MPHAFMYIAYLFIFVTNSRSRSFGPIIAAFVSISKLILREFLPIIEYRPYMRSQSIVKSISSACSQLSANDPLGASLALRQIASLAR